MEYYYEEDYPDCFGEEEYYSKQPACLTCVWKSSCYNLIMIYKEESEECLYDYQYSQ